MIREVAGIEWVRLSEHSPNWDVLSELSGKGIQDSFLDRMVLIAVTGWTVGWVVGTSQSHLTPIAVSQVTPGHGHIDEPAFILRFLRPGCFPLSATS